MNPSIEYSFPKTLLLKTKKKFLVEVGCHKWTGKKEVFAFYEVEASSEYYARSLTVDWFRNRLKYEPRLRGHVAETVGEEWCISDAVCLED